MWCQEMFLILPFLQVIVFYHHPSAQGVPVMWPGNKIPAPWANTTEPYKLIQVSEKLLCVCVYTYVYAHVYTP